MVNETGAHRRWRRRAITVVSLAATTVAAVTIPALAHPVFSNDPPGFPNPQGGTTSPYPEGSRPTVNMFLPFEQEGVIFKGAENTTVDVKVTIPAGWTNPACGNASTRTGNRQVGTVVPGWTCVIETVNAHQVLHWHGPQVSASQGFADSAQFFTFQVTVPSPTTQTSYGANGSTAEGFYVEQVYASTVDFSLWRTPNSTRPGEVANGIVRTVAGTTAPPPRQTVQPEPPETHAGPNPNRPNPPGAEPPVSNAPGAGLTTSTPAPPPQQGGGGPTPGPAGGPSPAGTPTAGGPSDGAQESPAPTSTGPSPGMNAQSQSAKQLAEQRDEAAGQGAGWRVLVGIVLAGVLVAGAAIAVVMRRRRSL